jgi:hypothetical protein
MIMGVVLEGAGAVLLYNAVLAYRRSASGVCAMFADSLDGTSALNTSVTWELNGVPYTGPSTPQAEGGSHHLDILRIGMLVGSRGDVQTAPEKWFDRVCKRLGLAVEIQTGDALFDRECYIRSDTPAFAAAYLADAVKREAILVLRRLGFLGIMLKDGMLTATWTGFDPRAHDTPELRADAEARLALLARNLPDDRSEFDHHLGIRRKQWQAAFWLFLVIFGLTIVSLDAYPLINEGQAVYRALYLFLLGLPVFAPPGVSVPRRS